MGGATTAHRPRPASRFGILVPGRDLQVGTEEEQGRAGRRSTLACLGRERAAGKGGSSSPRRRARRRTRAGVWSCDAESWLEWMCCDVTCAYMDACSLVESLTLPPVLCSVLSLLAFTPHPPVYPLPSLCSLLSFLRLLLQQEDDEPALGDPNHIPTQPLPQRLAKMSPSSFPSFSHLTLPLLLFW